MRVHVRVEARDKELTFQALIDVYIISFFIIYFFEAIWCISLPVYVRVLK